jgi:hypothetical protein
MLHARTAACAVAIAAAASIALLPAQAQVAGSVQI